MKFNGAKYKRICTRNSIQKRYISKNTTRNSAYVIKRSKSKLRVAGVRLAVKA